MARTIRRYEDDNATVEVFHSVDPRYEAALKHVLNDLDRESTIAMPETTRRARRLFRQTQRKVRVAA